MPILYNYSALEDKMDMKELYDVLPSIDETIKRITQDTESRKTCKLIIIFASIECLFTVAKLLMNWRRLMMLEATNGPLPGKKAILPQVIMKLKEASYYI